MIYGRKISLLKYFLKFIWFLAKKCGCSNKLTQNKLSILAFLLFFFGLIVPVMTSSRSMSRRVSSSYFLYSSTNFIFLSAFSFSRFAKIFSFSSLSQLWILASRLVFSRLFLFYVSISSVSSSILFWSFSDDSTSSPRCLICLFWKSFLPSRITSRGIVPPLVPPVF